MARDLRLKPQVDPNNSEYPFGRIRDDSSSGADDGTPVNEELYGDMHQFFAKLMASFQDVGGPAYNNQPENAYDDFQYYNALVGIIQLGIDVAAFNQNTAAWTDLTLGNNWVAQISYLGVDFHPPQYYKDPWGWVHLRGRLIRSNASDGNNLAINSVALPFVPSAEERQFGYASATSGSGAFQWRVMESGLLIPVSGFALDGLDTGGRFISLDGVHFKTDIAP